MNKDKKQKINEGSIKKGGLNPEPTSERPTMKPPAQPSKDTSENN